MGNVYRHIRIYLLTGSSARNTEANLLIKVYVYTYTNIQTLNDEKTDFDIHAYWTFEGWFPRKFLGKSL